MLRLVLASVTSGIAVLAAVAACGSGDDPPTSVRPQGAVSPVPIAMSDDPPSDWTFLAELSGSVQLSDKGCPGIASGAKVTTVVWPQGYSAWTNASGRVDVAAPDGSVVTSVGKVLSLTGGYRDAAADDCMRDGESVFVIGDDPASGDG